MEIWKPIENYETQYAVSTHGRVKRISGFVKTDIKNNSQRLIKERILKQNKKRNGYLTVDLSKENEVKTISVHRLVALAFVENTEGKPQVNHINANKQDNRMDNLEWVTGLENRNHAKENNLYKNPNKKAVRCIELNKEFASSYEAAEYTNNLKYKNSKQIKNISAKIRGCCNGFQKTAYGFHWVQI